GYRGLYVVPLVCLWIVWLLFGLVCRRLSLRPADTAFGLLVLVFASPLTVYGATYWEHTLAVALAFGGITLLIGPGDAGPSPLRLLTAGGLLGLAGWLRPENLCFAAAALAAWPVVFRPAGWLRRWLFLVGGTAVAVGVFLAFNQVVYRHPLGAHS